MAGLSSTIKSLFTGKPSSRSHQPMRAVPDLYEISRVTTLGLLVKILALQCENASVKKLYDSQIQEWAKISSALFSIISSSLSQVKVFNCPEQEKRSQYLSVSLDAIGGLTVARIRVALADDHYSVVARVRETLGDEFEVIGTAENGNQTVDAVPRLDADVL